MLVATDVRELLDYDPETGVFRWKKRNRNNKVKSDLVAGCVDSRGYRFIGIGGQLYTAHRLAWLYMTGEWPNIDIDHRDLDKTNNAWANLRIATRSQNLANKRVRSNNKTRLKGVGIVAGYPRLWRARINGDHLGCFNCPVAAHLAYVVAADSAFGEFARAS